MNIKPWKELSYEQLKVKVYENKVDLGRAAASLAAQSIGATLSRRERVNLVFSTGASQFQCVDGLRSKMIGAESPLST